jgi:hypothetical protein
MTQTQQLPPFTGDGDLVAICYPNRPVIEVRRNVVDGEQIAETYLQYEWAADNVLADLGYMRVTQWDNELPFPVATVVKAGA